MHLLFMLTGGGGAAFSLVGDQGLNKTGSCFVEQSKNGQEFGMH